MSDPLLELITKIAVLLEGVDQANWTQGLRNFALRLENPEPPTDRQQVVRDILSTYGGMGSFQDIVLQNSTGVRLEHKEFSRLRHLLFEQARGELE
jgi:hypothetical protein